jgi:hypothetical protein
MVDNPASLAELKAPRTQAAKIVRTRSRVTGVASTEPPLASGSDDGEESVREVDALPLLVATPQLCDSTVPNAQRPFRGHRYPNPLRARCESHATPTAGQLGFLRPGPD